MSAPDFARVARIDEQRALVVMRGIEQIGQRTDIAGDTARKRLRLAADWIIRRATQNIAAERAHRHARARVHETAIFHEMTLQPLESYDHAGPAIGEDVDPTMSRLG